MAFMLLGRLHMNPLLRIEKFVSRCKVMPNGCWVWTGMKSKTGYGQVKRDGKFIFAHRYSYMLHKGELGKLFVLHACDNRLCCNPDHLSLGTQKDNQQDMKRKKRHCHGERSPNAKLTNKDVLRMYRLHEGGMGTILLAREFGVTKNLAWRIVRGLQWEHLYEKRYGK
jgi:hypothetical protein